jgi:hypothetical protein
MIWDFHRHVKGGASLVGYDTVFTNIYRHFRGTCCLHLLGLRTA